MKRLYLWIVFGVPFIAGGLFLSLFWLYNDRGRLKSAKQILPVEEKKMVVIIPSYKNEKWYKKNLDSVFSQNYTNFYVVYIDDCSPDATYKNVLDYIKMRQLEYKITVINNKERRGALANLYYAIHACDDDAIVVTLDGDDWFSNSNVLSRLNREYADSDVWMTYGQYRLWVSDELGLCREIPTFIRWANLFRSYSWVASHLRTFYAGLFKLIKKEDLMHEGAFFSVTWDRAFMLPMLEMAGEHVRFIPDVLYIYNNANPINDGKVALQRVMRYERIIRSKSRYKPISTDYSFAKMHVTKKV